MRTTPTAGQPSWIELFTSDTDQAREFYGELFGWRAGEASEEFAGYFMFLHDGLPVAGCMDNAGGSMGPAAWSVYLHSDDLAATMERAADHGATAVAGPMQVGDAGHMGFLTDPQGHGIGLWQPISHPGFSAITEAGAPAWFELLTARFGDSSAFYRDTFGWDLHAVSDTDDFRYSTVGKDQEARVGIMDGAAAEDQELGWRVYIEVPDADAAAARAAELGGSVLVPPQDTAYGRMCAIADPAGATLTVLGPLSR
ncbi:VOC family protein [Nocardioides sp. dk4132]|uniref:VOC family protein n=1 Tax=unclassified Nocardioides TaxID=2615069 RepID=UPI001295F852|nr:MULTISPECIES: VOC family protein [unclassified Nocardioides]MQW74813.1 VOC family protein [Nocardioides sp. dk4132]QGA06705.1 VOC family protein [Nocardioides sp. dk884]